MPNICDSHMRSQFVRMIERCEAESTGALTEWEKRFVADLRERFESRDQDTDLGLTPWNPSVKQWNTLSEIAQKC